MAQSVSSNPSPISIQLDSGLSGYTFGHHPTITKSHASRTATSDASHLLPHLKPHHRILDIGCGPGTITAGFVPFVADGSGNVIGVDLSETVLAQARDLARKQGYVDDSGSKLRFVRGNIMEGLHFADETFDVVFASQLFPHLPDPFPALREMRRVLCPGGILATRDGAAMVWYPPSPSLTAFTCNLAKAVGTDFPGRKMHAYMRQVGFDPAKMVVGAGTTCIADAEGRRWWGECMAARLEKGADTEFRRGWVKAGVVEGEIEEVMAGLRDWGESEDGWYCMVQGEVLAWK